MMKRILLLWVFFLAFNAQGQNINDYQYVIVPTRFEFQKAENEYRLNTIIKYRLTQIGFKTFYDTEQLPVETMNNRCDKLFVSLNKSSPFLATKIEIVLKDCQNNVVFKGTGSSKEKEYKTAYVQALEKAIDQLAAIGYSFNGNTHHASTPVATPLPAKVETVGKPTTTVAIADVSENEILYAQAIEGGYQLVNSEPKVVFKIFKTSSADIYLATIDNYDGVLLSKDGKWILEYKKDGQLISKTLTIKF